MPARAHWKGYLKLSLVSCPIALYPAISAAEKVSFRQVNRQTGNRLRHQLVDVGTGEVVQPSDRGRGYQVGEQEYLVVQEHELEQAREEARARPFTAPPVASASRASTVPPQAPPVFENRVLRKDIRVEPPPAARVEPSTPISSPPRKIENNRTILIDRFVSDGDVDPRYHLTPYYIAPRDQVGEESFAVIREAMAGEGVVGMGRVVLANRERPIIIAPLANGIIGTTLRYAHEVRDAEEYFADIPELELPEELLDVARHLIRTKTREFDRAWLEDRYRTVIVEKLKAKAGELRNEVSVGVPSS